MESDEEFAARCAYIGVDVATAELRFGLLKQNKSWKELAAAPSAQSKASPTSVVGSAVGLTNGKYRFFFQVGDVTPTGGYTNIGLLAGSRPDALCQQCNKAWKEHYGCWCWLEDHKKGPPTFTAKDRYQPCTRCMNVWNGHSDQFCKHEDYVRARNEGFI